MAETEVEPGSPEHLQRHMQWLYVESGAYDSSRGMCRCEHAYKGLGRWPDGVMGGKGWVRTSTHPDCPHHGTVAERERKARHKVQGRY